MRHRSQATQSKYRSGVTLLEMMIVLGLVAILASITTAYNKGIERQIVIVREQATVLGMLVKARSAGLAIPKGEPGEVVCGFGVSIDTVNRTLVYFKDLGTAPADCTTADRQYTGAGEKIEQRILSSDVTMASEMSNIVFVPPFGTVFIDGTDVKKSAIITITSAAAGMTKQVKVNSFGQITES